MGRSPAHQTHAPDSCTRFTHLTYLDVPIKLLHYGSYVSDVLLQEKPGQAVASPFVLHFLQTVDNVIFNSEGVLHEGCRRLLVAEDPVFQLLHEAHRGVGRHGQGLAVSGHGSNSPTERSHITRVVIQGERSCSEPDSRLPREENANYLSQQAKQGFRQGFYPKEFSS